MDYKSLISNGKSVREFKNKKISKKYFKEIEDYINNSKKLLPKINFELKIFNKKNTAIKKAEDEYKEDVDFLNSLFKDLKIEEEIEPRQF